MRLLSAFAFSFSLSSLFRASSYSFYPFCFTLSAIQSSFILLRSSNFLIAWVVPYPKLHQLPSLLQSKASFDLDCYRFLKTIDVDDFARLHWRFDLRIALHCQKAQASSQTHLS